MHKHNRAEAGVVSIIVSLIMMLVIALVVLGFGQLARNEVEQALNKQLSMEAFYAANSAVNNAAAIVKYDLANNIALTSQTTSCTQDNGGGNLYNTNAALNGANVQYSCVVVNPAPTSLLATIAAGAFYATPLQVSSNSATPVSSITFSWHQTNLSNLASAAACLRPTGRFPAATSWPTLCPGGVLQVEFLPDTATSSSSVSNMENNDKTIFLYPGNISSSGQKVDQATCTNSGCSLTITSANLPQGGVAGRYYMRIMPLYEDTDLTVTATAAGSATNAQLYGSQVEIDATGKAQDVLQRISGRVDILNPGGVPFAVQTGGSLCKRIEGFSGYVDISMPGYPTYTSGNIGSLSSNDKNYSCSWQ